MKYKKNMQKIKEMKDKKFQGYYIENERIKLLYGRLEPLQAFTRGTVHRRK